MFAIYDAFNQRILSRHRTIEAAARGKAKFFREFYRNNTASSYLPTILVVVGKDGVLRDASDADREAFERIEATGR